MRLPSWLTITKWDNELSDGFRMMYEVGSFKGRERVTDNLIHISIPKVVCWKRMKR